MLYNYMATWEIYRLKGQCVGIEAVQLPIISLAVK